jgi:two-component system, NarL family, nitrate/nitrite response regulator NarL
MVGDFGLILLIDPDRETRALVEGLIARLGYEVRVAASGEEALALLEGDRPAIAIVEVELPGLNGLAVLEELHAAFGGDLPVILTTAERDTPLDRTAGLLLGADDYLVKPLNPAELSARIRRLLRQSEVAAGNGVGNRKRNGDFNLSPREHEILALLADGKTQREIAAALFISPKTVGTHIQRLLAKLGVHSRAQAVAVAYREGLVDEDVHGHAFTPARLAG